MTTRRRLLTGGLALFGTAAAGLPVLARAKTGGADHKVVVMFARGGWDTTRVFVDPFAVPSVSPPPGTVMQEAHGIPYVHHERRPEVQRFFQMYGHLTAVIDGMLVRSVNHKVCERLVLTGASRQGSPDWTSIIGSAAASEHALPSIVLSGPSAPGPLHRYASIVGSDGQLQTLMERSIFNEGELEVRAPSDAHLDLVDAALAQRVSSRLGTADNEAVRRMLEAMEDGLSRVTRLRTDASQVTFEGTSLGQQVGTAVSMLASGVARCVSVCKSGFDTHAENRNQDGSLDDFFSSLVRLVSLLESTPSQSGGVLLDETTVVVVSEMGRTPYVNNRDGKDHWPYTSAMLVGGRVRGGVKVGQHNSFLNGEPVDLASGMFQEDGVVLTPKNLGATLLQMSGIDPEVWVPGYAPIDAVIGS